MSISFTQDQWAKVKTNYAKWWKGELGRPLLFVTVGGRDPGRKPPKLTTMNPAIMYDLTISPEDIVDRWDYEMSFVEYLGDAIPCVWPNMGPGVVATAIGAEAEPTDKTVWFHPKVTKDINEISFKYDPDSKWIRRIKDICRCAMKRWQGQVQVGMTDLGGNLDVVSTFRPSESLLLDLYDHPEDVKRLTQEAHVAWWQAFHDIDSALKPVNPGYTAWTPIFSEKPYYMLQCDFAYMIGPEMFDEFVRPELADTCKKLSRSFYHLDGQGQIPHIESLTSIKELDGIQWVPGSGSKPQVEWPDVYGRIAKGGKLIQIHEPKALDMIEKTCGAHNRTILICYFKRDNMNEARKLLERYGAV